MLAGKVFFQRAINQWTVTPPCLPRVPLVDESLMYSCTSGRTQTGTAMDDLPFCNGVVLTPSRFSNFSFFNANRECPDREVRIAGERVIFHKMLGDGSTKVVYDVEWRGTRFALACPYPNATSDYNLWQNALTEPNKTAIVRGLGLKTNPFFDVVPVAIDGIEYPAIAMRRYEDLPWEISDVNNPSSSTIRSSILHKGDLTLEYLKEIFDPLVDDYITLLRNGILVDYDSLNCCLDENRKLRLYLNDLGGLRDLSIERELEDFCMLKAGSIIYPVQKACKEYSFGEDDCRNFRVINRKDPKLIDLIAIRLYDFLDGQYKDNLAQTWS